MSAPKKKPKETADAPMPENPDPAMEAPSPDTPTQGAPAPASPSVQHRVVAPLQVRGNLGKSTEAIVRGSRSTEDLRQALLHYRALFEEMVNAGGRDVEDRIDTVRERDIVDEERARS